MRVPLHSIHLSRRCVVVPGVIGTAVTGRPRLVEHADLVVLDELDELLQDTAT